MNAQTNKLNGRKSLESKPLESKSPEIVHGLEHGEFVIRRDGIRGPRPSREAYNPSRSLAASISARASASS
jgi:hypothetical protein